MKSILFILVLINYIFPQEETGKISGLLFDVEIGQNLTKIKLLLSTSTINNTLFSNSNRRYAKDIQ